MPDLNLEQRQAIEHGEGPLLVIAGPGSGKTRVITERIVHLLRTVPRLEAENILALTFTEKAAIEMKTRVRLGLGDQTKPPHISTFHSFCHGILRERHEERPLLDEVDIWIFLRQRMELLGLEFYQKLAEPGAFLHDLNAFYSRCQDELIEPDDFEAHARECEKAFRARRARLDPAAAQLEEETLRKLLELGRVFRNSRRLIEEAGCSSFGSLIPETVRLFDREPEVGESWRRRFHYVLVDELQDTNFGQVELLRRLVVPPFNLTAVGDDDQAIYRFRGAAHGAFEMFAAAFPRPRIVHLHRNYRSTRRILRAAQAVIAHNVRFQQKPALTTENEEGARAFLMESADYASEAAWVAEEIARLARKEGFALGHIAVLYRGHNYRDLLVNELRRRNIPFSIRGLSVLSTVILRDLIAYLRVIRSPHDNIHLTRVLLAPRWRFPEGLAMELRRQASRERCSLYDVLAAWEKSPARARLAETGWSDLKKLIVGLRRLAPNLPVTRLFDLLLEWLELGLPSGSRTHGYVKAFRDSLAAWEQKMDLVPQLSAAAGGPSEAGPNKTLAAFMEYFDYFLDAGGKVEAPAGAGSSGAVEMMSVHAAKGLEFPVVFILSVAPRRFPSTERKPVIAFPDALRKAPAPPENLHLQEERRLFFVAMTRAQQRLYVSSVKTGKKPSRFIEDLLSGAAVTAQDIETIQVPEVAAPPAPAPRRLTLTETRAPEGRQGSLFSESALATATARTDLIGWATQAPEMAAGEKLQLSASAIEQYEDCPQKFKFSHYLKIPTGPQAALTFGNVMHQCVRRYFELRKQGLPRFEEIAELYHRAWRATGFEDDYQEQEYKKAGLAQLEEFVRRHESSAIPAEKVRSEETFALDLGDVVLEGRIDQINPLESAKRGGDSAVELVDYKTGRPRSEKDAEKSLQLSIYALAAREQMKLHPARLTFYNLTNNQAVSTARTEEDLKAVVREVREVAAQIRGGDFSPRPGFVCRWCDYRPVCPAHEELDD
jgi:DNA helicase-2/ATP-dependent DNA helicase PcrA